MSFFAEVPNDESNQTVVLFSTHKDNEQYKRFLSEMGGTFCRELETRQGNKHPAWVFDIQKKLEVEAFVAEHEDRESVQSLPDIELILDEIFRRIENLEKTVHAREED